MNNQAIGLIDSGYGGLSLAKELKRLLPLETLLYFGDNARAPYGNQELSQVEVMIHQLADFLIEEGVKAIVVACNTGTVAALDSLVKRWDIPILGVIDGGVEAAVQTTQNKKMGLIATRGTIESQVYPQKIKALDPDIIIYEKACPHLVDLVESGQLSGVKVDSLVASQLEPIKQAGVDSLILGCTHFPLLSQPIQKYMGSAVSLVDPGVNTIQELANQLKDLDLLAEERQGEDLYYTSGDPLAFARLASQWLALEDVQVSEINIGGA
ncbi:glutamate racemase [Hutsoniella sourekii]|uniref:glutamate racemase n=1 Tax=Hutsoniella sourekii TaxID=87650 RepID=UPI000484ABBA|nr:glutamate racemase [Hutsoniella sourekii]